MTSCRDVVLTLALTAPREPLEDLARFRRVWSSLLSKNPGLLRSLRAVLFLVEGDAELARPAIREAATLSDEEDLTVLTFAGPSLGRCYNDALLWLRASGVPYWLLWDDAHEATRPFWDKCLEALRTSPDVWLLRLDDAAVVEDARVELREHCAVVRPHPDEASKRNLDPGEYDESDEAYVSLWPSFSLGPGLHRADVFADVGTSLAFDERPLDTWPELQWRFGLRWEAAGGIVAVLQPAAARYVYDDDMEV